MTQIEQMITDSLFAKLYTLKNPVNHPNPEHPDSDSSAPKFNNTLAVLPLIYSFRQYQLTIYYFERPAFDRLPLYFIQKIQGIYIAHST